MKILNKIYTLKAWETFEFLRIYGPEQPGALDQDNPWDHEDDDEQPIMPITLSMFSRAIEDDSQYFDDDDSDWDIDNDDEHENDSDPLDVCPFCQGPMTPGMAAYGMCDACSHEQDGGEW